MAKSLRLKQAVRIALATAAAGGAVASLQAQQAQAPSPSAEAGPIQEVVVTGSRLATPNATSISPITSVSAADVEETGLTRVEDILNNLPMVFAGQNSTTSNGADGTATIDLRGLGNQRTLTLVNGLRLGPGSATLGRNYSDINQVPAALIERVDILTGGASSTYGADAVAGVVNFILNTHFEGIKVDASYHFSQHDNKDQDGVANLVSQAGDFLPTGNVNSAFGKSVSVIAGANFADNKGNATGYLTYDNQGAALQNKFDYSACSLGPATGGPLACQGSGTSRGGRFYASTPGGASFIHHTVLPNGQFANIGTPGNQDTYNFGPLNYYQTPSERWSAGGFINYELNSHADVYMNIMYTRHSASAQIAESGDFFQASFIPCADPLLTAQESATICTPANLAAQGNPTETYNGVVYPGLNFVIGRRNVEGGDRIATFINNAAREVLGIKGDITDAWTYNAYAQHGTVETDDTNENYTSNPLLQQALNVLPGPTGPVCGGPTGPFGPLVPTSIYFPFLPTTTVSYGVNSKCVPWNIWSPGGVTPAALAFLTIPQTQQGTVEEYVVDGSVNGDLGKYGLQLPSADEGMQVNLGAEWRSEASNFLPDLEEQQGNGGGGAGQIVPIQGEFTVKEVFTEFRLPLARHQPFADDLSVEAGYRYSKYSEGFDTNTYKVGLEWAAVQDIRLRGSYQRAVRAPNIGELYAATAVLLDGSSDPCTGAAPSASLAACELTGVTAAQYGHIPGNPASQYNGVLGGNPSLKPETADTYTLGLVLTPRMLPNLSLSLDYFNIKIADVIAFAGGNAILLDCLSSVGNASQTAQFCPMIHRDPSGSLWRTTDGYVIDPTVNEGGLATKGIDLKASYRVPVASAGSLLVSLEGTYLQSLTTTPIPGFGSYDCVGYFGATCGAANPTWRHVMNVDWATPWDALDLNLRWRYLGADKAEELNPSPILAGAVTALPRIPQFSYLDIGGTFNLYKNVKLQLGINNLFDKAPPLVTGVDCSTSSPAGANCNGNTFPGVYDAMGRYIFMHLSAQF